MEKLYYENKQRKIYIKNNGACKEINRILITFYKTSINIFSPQYVQSDCLLLAC